MSVLPVFREMHPELTAWRRELHQYPQTAFEETFASEFIAERLTHMGIEVHRGLAKTGVVGTLKGKLSAPGTLKRTGLRADIDALDIHELNEFPHKSRNPGKMHACGHDGHTTMLLGAAKYLAETRQFAGTVHFIFQPAEENEGGGRVMVEEGLFEQFPVDAVFGMHNWPGLDVGKMAMRSGPIMAAFDVFEIHIHGQGAHAALPHRSIDPVAVAGQLITALQTICSRNADPMEQLVISVTQVHAGDTWNVIPGEAVLRGTVRTFKPELQSLAHTRIEQIAQGVCQAFGASCEVDYQRRYPATVNSAQEVEYSATVADQLFGAGNVVRNPTPSMGAEDFAFMLQQKPGAYVWLGAGPAEKGRLLHNPHYDFNDEILPWGASFWASLVQRLMNP